VIDDGDLLFLPTRRLIHELRDPTALNSAIGASPLVTIFSTRRQPVSQASMPRKFHSYTSSRAPSSCTAALKAIDHLSRPSAGQLSASD
jgi:hypothetical protein